MSTPDTTEQGDTDAVTDQHMVLGGRHGSPTVNISLPFSKLTFGDDPSTAEALDTLAGIVLRLTAQVARLAEKAGADDVRAEVDELADQVAAVLSDLGGGD